jgi:hypothetical protein
MKETEVFMRIEHLFHMQSLNFISRDMNLALDGTEYLLKERTTSVT